MDTKLARSADGCEGIAIFAIGVLAVPALRFHIRALPTVEGYLRPSSPDRVNVATYCQKNATFVA
jgi:hypothetical protein